MTLFMAHTQPSQFWMRSRLIVDRGLQFNLITRMVMYVLFVFCVIGAVLFSPMVRKISGGADPDSLAMAEALLFMQARFWPVAALCLVVAVLGAVFTSHRIAGPLVRVKRIMRFVQEGHFPRQLRTRPGDYFRSEVEVLNGMVGGLADNIGDLKRVKHELDQALVVYGMLRGESADRDVHEAFEHLKHKIGELQDQLDQFSEQGKPDPEELQNASSSRYAAATSE